MFNRKSRSCARLRQRTVHDGNPALRQLRSRPMIPRAIATSRPRQPKGPSKGSFLVFRSHAADRRGHYCKATADHFSLALKKIENFRFHDLRHTFASWYMMNGLCELAKILGHSNIKMTERYAKLARRHIAKTGSTAREIWKLMEVKAGMPNIAG